ncbi:MAG: ATP-dependent DNA helicase RecG [Zetaproteobacteria bacterium]|nr:MAG: ATP-dependent DNA helicase RecG [Zetaproteobacteria bacterium]
MSALYRALLTPIGELAGVGARRAARLERGGIRYIGDLLLHLPKACVDDRRITPVCRLVPGVEARVCGRVVRRDARGMGRDTQVRLLLEDEDGGRIALNFFHAGFMLRDARLAVGRRITARGRVDQWNGRWQMAHPEWQPEECFVPGWLPRYAVLAGIGGMRLRGLLERAQQLLDDTVGTERASPLDGLVEGPPLIEALRLLHRSDTTPEARRRARLRLCDEEVLVYLALLERQRRQAAEPAQPCCDERLVGRVRAALPFALTEAQQQADAAIGADLASGRRMHRLLQGDVGCGKTVVAALAVARAIGSGLQAAVMAPTEALAEQLHRAMGGLLAAAGIEPLLLTGSTPARQRRQVCAALADGSAPLVVGTHALLGDGVAFARLGLAVVDEQHRFGVRQRWGLTEKGAHVHLLAMSATPIPRSLALALYGDMELTVMRGMPEGRKPVDTRLLHPSAMPELLAGVERLVAQGAGVYWIVPFVEDEELSVDARVEYLRGRLRGVVVDGLHGQMRNARKQEVLARFAAGEVDLLVSTTVVEVGVDVPHARLIVIERAEQYGLAQLHQLRGRVGRSSAQGYCMLLPGGGLTESGWARLRKLTECHDGLALAEFDLEQRGGGDAVGSRQSGDPGFRLLDLTLDAERVRRWHDGMPDWSPTPEMVRFWRPLALER